MCCYLNSGSGERRDNAANNLFFSFVSVVTSDFISLQISSQYQLNISPNIVSTCQTLTSVLDHFLKIKWNEVKRF